MKKNNEEKALVTIYIKQDPLSHFDSDDQGGLYLDIKTIEKITGFSRERIYLYAMRKGINDSQEYEGESLILLPLADMFVYLQDNFRRLSKKANPKTKKPPVLEDNE